MNPLVAPARLTAEHRLEFRRSALETLEEAARGGRSLLEVDLHQTTEMDASGLGILVLLQKRARERGVRIRLLSASRPVYELFHVTRLDALFEFKTAE